jgi:hypothetical protein
MVLGSLKERVYLKDPNKNRSVILKFILKKQEGRTRNGLIWLRIKKSKGCCARGNRISGSTKGGKFIVYLRKDYLLQKGPAPWSWLRAIFLPRRWRHHVLLCSCFPCSKLPAVSPRIPPHLTEIFGSILRHGKLQNVYRPLDGSVVVAAEEAQQDGSHR